MTDYSIALKHSVWYEAPKNAWAWYSEFRPDGNTVVRVEGWALTRKEAEEQKADWGGKLLALLNDQKM